MNPDETLAKTMNFPCENYVFLGTRRSANQVGLEEVPARDADGLPRLFDGLRVSQHPGVAVEQGCADMAHHGKNGAANMIQIKVAPGTLLLDFDKTLAEQPEAKKALHEQPDPNRSGRVRKTLYRFQEDRTGADVFRALTTRRASEFGGMIRFETPSPDGAARELARLGFAGVCTLDADSRAGSKGQPGDGPTRTMVFFDHRPLMIVGENGKRVADTPVREQAFTFKSVDRLRLEFDEATREWAKCEDGSPELSDATDKVFAARKAWAAKKHEEEAAVLVDTKKNLLTEEAAVSSLLPAAEPENEAAHKSTGLNS